MKYIITAQVELEVNAASEQLACWAIRGMYADEGTRVEIVKVTEDAEELLECARRR